MREIYLFSSLLGFADKEENSSSNFCHSYSGNTVLWLWPSLFGFNFLKIFLLQSNFWTSLRLLLFFFININFLMPLSLFMELLNLIQKLQKHTLDTVKIVVCYKWFITIQNGLQNQIHLEFLRYDNSIYIQLSQDIDHFYDMIIQR